MPKNTTTQLPDAGRNVLLGSSELDALVYQTIRVHQDKPKSKIMKILKETVPKGNHRDIAESLLRLM